jgi:outer membrane protein insertion porin family
MKLWVWAFCRLCVAALVLGAVTLGMVAGAVATADPAAAQTIEVRGNRRVEASTIRQYFQLAPGERLDSVKLDSAYKSLIATGLFQDVQIATERGRIVVTVIEAPVINRIQFEGNRRVKDEQLAAEIQSKPRGTLSRSQVQADVVRIIEVYRANGRFDIRVNPKIIELPNSRVDLVFEITEGQKTTVKQLIFVGNNAFSDRTLKDVIKTSESGILSFLKTTDVYDADRIEADRDLLRRFYLKKGYADVRIIAAAAQFDPSRNGFLVTFTIEEGDQYRFGGLEVVSNVRDVDVGSLRAKLKMSSGSVYNAELVEKSVEDMTIELSKRGYAFAQVRPRGDRDVAAHVLTFTFVVEEGARAYIERINIIGNTRTRDYVIRREFDIAEGDAYNRVLVDRAERRLKNLAYFKTVKITNEPGSAPDRVVINVTVEEQSTGEFSVSGGYSTSDGIIGEVSVAERNLLGRGLYAKASASWGSYSKGASFSFVEPYMLGYRISTGFDIFYKETSQSNYQSYNSTMFGGGIRFGLPLREDLAIQLRYSAYRQEITLPATLNNCNNVNPDFVNTFPTPDQFAANAAFQDQARVSQLAGNTAQTDCMQDSEASLAIKSAVLSGPTITSLVGYTLSYNTLDNNKNPTNGLFAELRQDFAGIGGDVNFIKTTADVRYYYPVYADIVSLFRVQAGHVQSWGSQDLRMLDHFFMGPNLVRGFAPNGIGPRDLTLGTNFDALGGTMYWGATLELQSPIPGIPKDIGLKVAVFADAGSLWDYRGLSPEQLKLQFNGQTIVLSDNSMNIRSSVGAGLLWDSPFGPLRIDYARALTKEDCVFPFVPGGSSCDKLQSIRFSGGTRF